MSPQRFTTEEANRLIPRLSEILAPLQEKKRELDALQAKLLEFVRQMSGNGHILERRVNETRMEAEKTAAALSDLIEMVNNLGCELKDIDLGLVDFRAVLGGREVYLCWKLGEDHVRWWHELDTGFGGRQPLEDTA
ncbi:MAG: DUF2203 domain-containing protein [Dehalococcoidia bacterium]